MGCNNLTVTDKEGQKSLLTERQDVLPQNAVKSRSHAIGCHDDLIVLKFDRHLDSATADVPVKFWSD